MAADPSVKETDLNRSQALLQLINPNIAYCLWPRAGGKTSGGIGPRILHLSEVMPRSQVLLFADTFERIEKVLLPSIENFLIEELGLIQEVDFVTHKKPPEHWTKPLFVPKKWDHVIAFATGFCLCEVSMSVPGSGNGFNAQAAIGDEVKYIDEKKFKSEVRPAIRGGKKLFGHLAEFQSIWFFSDKFPSLGADIGWVLKKKKLVDQQTVDIIYTLKLTSIKLEQELESCESESSKYRKQKEIDEIEDMLRVLRKDLVYYSDALPYENIDVLGEKYFRDLQRDLTKYEYAVAIENLDPDRAIEPFYPNLSSWHYYKGLQDYNPNKSLIIALDYQFAITPIVTAQFDRLPGSPYLTLNFISSLHALHDEGGQDKALEKWCDHFESHPNKIVYYIFDQTAVGRTPRGTTFKQYIVDALTLRGWAVIEVYTGDTPDHDIKFEILKKLMSRRADGAIRMNETTNEYLKVAMEKTDAVLSGGKTKKDKTSEKSKKVPPEESTHYPDAFDQIAYGALELQLIPWTDDSEIDISSLRK